MVRQRSHTAHNFFPGRALTLTLNGRKTCWLLLPQNPRSRRSLAKRRAAGQGVVAYTPRLRRTTTKHSSATVPGTVLAT